MADDQRRAAIVDIGSNSVRLVVYAGPPRAPQPIFNEKLMAGLGASLATTGRIEEPAYSRAINGLARFKMLTDAMAPAFVKCVATAAVRDASNGMDFMADAQTVGHPIELLSGQDEARASGYGVISAIPDADGIVADLGGGSLELVRVRSGKTMHHSSFPTGVLRIPPLQVQHGKRFDRFLAQLLADAGWPGEDRCLPLYLVGGSWRALARYHMMITDDPTPVLSRHVMTPDVAGLLNLRLRKIGTAELSQLQGLSSARVETIPAAAAILEPLVRHLASSALVMTTSGLREGLLFQQLNEEERARDPLIVAAAALGRLHARFAPNGEAIDQWIAPLFVDDAPGDARLRLAASLLSDLAFGANPDFRTEHARELALHGQWLGVDGDDRLILAQTLYTCVGGQGRITAPTDAALMARMQRAVQWGLAIRLAQRLSGGSPAIFASAPMVMTDRKITINLPAGQRALLGEQALRRFHQLGSSLGRSARLVEGG